jgi:LPXTG-motif cell wall-anchored protein
VLTKLVQGEAVYTAYFLGEEIRTPLEMTEPPAAKPTEQTTPEPTPEATATPEPTEAPSPTDEPAPTDKPAEPTDEPAPPDDGETKNINALYIAIPILAAIAGAVFYIFKKRKGTLTDE